jgi:hypothetical protein
VGDSDGETSLADAAEGAERYEPHLQVPVGAPVGGKRLIEARPTIFTLVIREEASRPLAESGGDDKFVEKTPPPLGSPERSPFAYAPATRRTLIRTATESYCRIPCLSSFNCMSSAYLGSYSV